MYKIAPNTPLACRPHDHANCVASALAEADTVCARQGVRLTELRRRVLELVWQSHKPLGAYDILAVLSETDGRRAAPPTVYRALDFLLENGLVHRIASLNAFVGCNNPEHAHEGQFLICRACHTAIELEQPAISDAIVAGARDVGFAVETQTVEVVGLCSACNSDKSEA
ncbi:zinc uptake transcriptional repressor Zur [Pseudomonas schmalbachii]|uniref:Zinc uptake transcriptional repressor Zur n=1 Tax=Pseudomonas schmalbachii TaxID=2816993 RepID=A0ABS3TR24_9PSED|nr:zinc uptake transcriptional repressor Zur [Pseudomonas schmalbachii]MBO3276116.1 zinc uptake transcriptional repressor Zur [Pseudomonas schmalbachii]